MIPIACVGPVMAAVGVGVGDGGLVGVGVSVGAAAVVLAPPPFPYEELVPPLLQAASSNASNKKDSSVEPIVRR